MVRDARETCFGGSGFLGASSASKGAVFSYVSQTLLATDNIFGAGYGDTPDPAGNGGGTPAPGYPLPTAAGCVLTMTNVSGTIAVYSNGSNNADGVGSFGTAAITVNSYRSLSGITMPHEGALVGVFGNGSTPTGTAPATLNFISLGTSFQSISPQLDQLFVIGDGLTGNGMGNVQSFYAPVGATMLYLGIADSPTLAGNPGGYYDNSGYFTASFSINTVVPEPATLLAIPSALIAALSQRARRKPL